MNKTRNSSGMYLDHLITLKAVLITAWSEKAYKNNHLITRTQARAMAVAHFNEKFSYMSELH